MDYQCNMCASWIQGRKAKPKFGLFVFNFFVLKFLSSSILRENERKGIHSTLHDEMPMPLYCFCKTVWNINGMFFFVFSTTCTCWKVAFYTYFWILWKNELFFVCLMYVRFPIALYRWNLVCFTCSFKLPLCFLSSILFTLLIILYVPSVEKYVIF